MKKSVVFCRREAIGLFTEKSECMADVHSPKQRSFNMSRIRNKDTKPEMLVRKFLFSKGLRYRLHDPKLPGKPDLTFPSRRMVVFVHGCFWHGHEGCRYFKMPQTRQDWWLEKIGRNREKDVEAEKELKMRGWKVIIVYECELRPKNKDQTLLKLLQTLKPE